MVKKKHYNIVMDEHAMRIVDGMPIVVLERSKRSTSTNTTTSQNMWKNSHHASICKRQTDEFNMHATLELLGK